MYSTYDIPVLFTQILMAAPWIRNGQMYIAGSWKTWDNEQLGQSEAQVKYFTEIIFYYQYNSRFLHIN